MSSIIVRTASACLCGAALGAAAAPVALVEDVQGKVTGIEAMDYVDAGRVIELGARDTLVLGYLKSCWRETITGGTVTVGDEQSSVRQGQVERTKIACGTARKAAGGAQRTQSAAAVFRGVGREPTAEAPGPQLMHGRAPLVEVNDQRGLLVIERIDIPIERFEFRVEGEALVRGRFFDIARTSIRLTPGAAYTATLGALKAEFEVDLDAPPGATPAAGRLLRLE